MKTPGALREKSYVYLVASGLMTITLMVIAVFGLVILNGVPNFWPKDLHRFEMKDGQKYLGEIHGREVIFEEDTYRIRIKIGNREVNGLDFTWLDEKDIVKQDKPESAYLLERLEWGNAYGFTPDIHEDDLQGNLDVAERQREEIQKYEKKYLVKRAEQIAEARHRLRTQDDDKLRKELDDLQAEYNKGEAELEKLRRQASEAVFTLKLADGQEMQIPMINVLHAYQVNGMSFREKLSVFGVRFWEFIFSKPRESNTEGGVFPALYGTVLMVFLMSIVVFPFGVIAAVFLHEYAKRGLLLKLVNITIYNLAGVPSIVYGVFGLGFFIYTVGGWMDQTFFSSHLPSPTFGTGGILWASMTLAVLTLPVVVVASLEGLQAVPEIYREGSYALGATKWEVIRDVVIPNAMPGMLTGLILAISRAAGEVAPLMLTGVVKSAPSLPLDQVAPFLHLERKFMHLGFHIYDVGFQSPNVEAARPMVFNTTLLLLIVVFALNLVAIIIRNKLRKKFLRSGV